MAKLKLTPLLAVSPPIIGGMIDRATSARWDMAMEEVTVIVAGNEAKISALWDRVAHRWQNIDVTIYAHASSTTAARVNRLLTGTGAPRAETYHRTGSIVIRARQHAYPLPASMDIALQPDGTYRTTVRTLQTQVSPAAPALPPVSPFVGGVIPPPPNPAQASIPTTAATPAEMARLRLDELAEEAELAEAEAHEAKVALGLIPEPEPETVLTPDISEPKSEPETVKVAPVTQRDPSGLMHFPVRNATDRIELDSENRDVLETYWKKHISGDQSILAIVGPSGTGKTSLIWDLAAEKQVGLFMFDAAGASSFTDWTGTTVLRQGEGSPVTEFITSAFIEFARIDGPCAGMTRLGGIDELNRAESGGALNALLPILAQGQLFIPELGETIVFDPAVMWIFTMNRGSAYNATLSLDAALSDRVQAWVKLDNLTEKEEIKLLVDRVGVDANDAARLVATAAQVRIVADRGELTHSISIRRTLDAARAVKHGLSLMQAAMFCWANSYLDEGGQESDRGKVETAIRTTLGTATTDNSTPW